MKFPKKLLFHFSLTWLFSFWFLHPLQMVASNESFRNGVHEKLWKGELEVYGETGVFYLSFHDIEGNISVQLTCPKANIYGAQMGQARKDEADVWQVAFFKGSFSKSGDVFDAVFDYYEKHIPIEFRPTESIPVAPDPIQIPVREPEWRFETNETAFGSPVLASDSRTVYFGTMQGAIIALNVESGEPMWKTNLSAPICSSPLVLHVEDSAAEVIVVCDDGGNVYQLNAGTGGVDWTIQSSAYADSGSPTTETNKQERAAWDRYSPAPVEFGMQIICATLTGHILFLDRLRGELLQTYVHPYPIFGTPALAGEILVFADMKGTLNALDLDSNSLVWTQQLHADTPCSPLIYDQKVILGCRNADLFGFDLNTGEPLWQRYFWTSWVESSVIEKDGILYVGSSDIGDVSARDPDTGEAIWKTFVEGSAWSTPVVRGNELYIGVVGAQNYVFPHQGAFYCLDKTTGEPLWKINIPAPTSEDTGAYQAYGVKSTPVVSDDSLIFITTDGVVAKVAL